MNKQEVKLNKEDFPDSKKLVTEEDGEEDIEEMSHSLTDLKPGEEDNNNDSTLNTNMEEVRLDFVTVDASETGEDNEVFEKCARRKKQEQLKGKIERVKQQLKEG